MTEPISIRPGFTIGDGRLFLIAGPCVIEGEDHVVKMASRIRKITHRLGIPFILKASFDKANRTSIRSYRGPGIDRGLWILKTVSEEVGVPVLSDIHTPDQAVLAAEALDVIQIPALLCRQTDLVVEAARTGKALNIKKGQFMAPLDMRNVIMKALESGNENLMLTERGNSFGYNCNVVDMRGIAMMRRFGFPVVMDASHSAQAPGAAGDKSAGDPSMIPVLARAGVAAGASGLFIEVHDDPEKALSDGPNSLPLDQLEGLLKQAKAIYSIMEEHDGNMDH